MHGPLGTGVIGDVMRPVPRATYTNGFPKIRGTFLGVPIINTDDSILGCILGSPYSGKLPHLNLSLKYFDLIDLCAQNSQP